MKKNRTTPRRSRDGNEPSPTRDVGLGERVRALPGATWVIVALGVALLAVWLNDRSSSRDHDPERATPDRAPSADTPTPTEPEAESEAVPGTESGGLEALGAIGVTAEELDALVAALGRLPLHTPVWIAYPRASPRAAAASYALGSAFEQAGAVVRATTALDYSVRPGLFVFAAEETYPSYVDDVAHALGAAIEDVAVMSGYRAYGDAQRAENPAWQGVRMDHGETYVVVIGRVP